MRRVCDVDFPSMLEHSTDEEHRRILKYIIDMYTENEKLIVEYISLRNDMMRFRDYDNLNNALKMEMNIKVRSFKSHQSLINTNWNMILMRLFKMNRVLEFKPQMTLIVPKGLEIPEIDDSLVRVKNEVNERGIKRWYEQMVMPTVLPPLENATPEMYAEIRSKRDSLKEYLFKILFEIDQEQQEMNQEVQDFMEIEKRFDENEISFAIRDVAGPELVACPLEIQSARVDPVTGLNVNTYKAKEKKINILNDMCLMRFTCVQCNKDCSDFTLRERLTVKNPENMRCRECSQDPAIYHKDLVRLLVPSMTLKLDDVFAVYDLFSKISLFAGRFVTMMCVSNFWRFNQRKMIYDKRIPRYYYTDAQKDYCEEASLSNDIDFDTDENSLECNVLRFIELPVDFFWAYEEIINITLNECTCEEWKIKISFIYLIGPHRFDLNCLVLDYYHPLELKPLIHLLPWNDNCRTDSSTKVFFCYFNQIIDDYLLEVCYIPVSRLSDFKEKNLNHYRQFIVSVCELEVYSRQFWWYDKCKFAKFAKLCANDYHKMIDLMRNESSLDLDGGGVKIL